MKITKIFRTVTFILSGSLFVSIPSYALASSSNAEPVVVVSSEQQSAANKRLDAYFEALLKHNQFIGSVALYKDGILSYQTGLTMADETAGLVSKTEQALQYRVGSISKTFTSVMILQLIEEGKLNYDSKLSEFYPKVKNAEKISISQLLTHHTGIRSFTDDPKFWNIYLTPQTSATIMGMIEGYDSDFEPGSEGKYSNSNYYLLGHIIEKITKMSYADSLKKRVADKIGLKHTYYGGKIGGKKNEVQSYLFAQDKWNKSPESDMSMPHGAGAVVSTTADLNQFVHALFAGMLINKASLDSMLTDNDGYGKGIFKASFAGSDSYGHGGSIDGFRSLVQYIPDTKVSFAILSNGMNASQKEIADNLLLASEGKLVDIPEFKNIEIAADLIQQMIGQYKSGTHPLGIGISDHEGKLFAQADGQGAFPLTAKSQTLFEFKDAEIEIEFDVKTKSFVIKQGSREDIFSLVKIKTKTVSSEIFQRYIGMYKSPSFPLDIEVSVKDGKLMAQATGQGAFPLTPESETKYRFVPAGIEINFDVEKSQLIISQGGNDTVMTKD